MEREWKELVKSIHKVGMRTIGKTYGKAAVQSMSQELREAIRERREELREIRKRSGKGSKGRYEDARRRVRGIKTQERHRKECRIIGGMRKGRGQDSRRFWQVYGKQKHTGSGEIYLRDKEGKIIEEPKKQMEMVEDHWAGLYTAHRVQEGERQEWEGVNREGEFQEDLVMEISREEVVSAIKDLARGKAMGVDDIPNEFLKEGGGEVLIDWVTRLLNIVVTREEALGEWKKGLVTALHKGRIKGGVDKLSGNNS